MKQLLVTKDTVNYAYDTTAGGDIDSAWDIDTLDEGALAAFEYDGDDAGKLIDDASPTINSTCTAIYFGLGTAEGRAIITPPLHREGFSYVKDAYTTDAAAKTMFLGNDQAAATGGYGSMNYSTNAITTGDTYGVYVIDLDKSVGDGSRMKHYGLDYVSGDLKTGTGATNIITKLVALINADPNAIVTATAYNDGAGNNDGILFTGVAGANFTIAKDTDSYMGNATVAGYKMQDGTYNGAYTTAAAYVPGDTISANLTTLLGDTLTHDGYNNSNLLGGTLWTESSPVESSKKYTVYTIKSTAPPTSKLEGENPISFTLYIAVPYTETGAGESITALDNILATV